VHTSFRILYQEYNPDNWVRRSCICLLSHELGAYCFMWSWPDLTFTCLITCWKLFSLTYPFSLYLFSSLAFSFLWWSPNPWCEQMWRLLVIVMLAGRLRCSLASWILHCSLLSLSSCVLLFCSFLSCEQISSLIKYVFWFFSWHCVVPKGFHSSIFWDNYKRLILIYFLLVLFSFIQ